MVYLKKIIFAPLALISLAILLYTVNSLLNSYAFIFSLSLNTFIQLISLSGLITFVSFCFVLFAAVALDWKLVLPMGLLSSLIPLLFMDADVAIILMVIILVSLLLSYLRLENSMKGYLNFNPNSILGPVIRHLSTLLILGICVIYFLNITKQISQKGFEIPDSLIDTALKFSSPQTAQTSLPLPSIPAEQLELLRKNPQLLKQSGLDPKILDNLTNSQLNSTTTSNDLIKQTIRDQIRSFLKPYLNFIPAVLAILLFLTLQSLVSIFNLFVYPLLWLTFYILEKSGFVKYTVEQRPVKKLVV